MKTRYSRCVGAVCGLMGVLAGCAVGAGRGAPVDSRAILASLPVGEGPTLLAMSPDGSRVYAAANSKLSVISTASNSIVATLTTEPYPAGLALTPDGTHAFITNLFAVNMTVVDLTKNAVAAPIELFNGQFRGGFGFIAFSPSGKVAYVANAANQVLAVVDTITADTDSLMMDMRPVDIAFSASGRTAYVVGCKDFCTTGTIEVLDTGSQTVTTSMSVGPQPYHILLSPDGARAYTTNLTGPSVSVVDLAMNQTTATIPVPVEPTGLALSSDGALIFVGSQTTGTITVIRTADNTVQAKVKVADDVRDVVVTPDARRLYVSTLHSVIAVDIQSLLGH